MTIDANGILLDRLIESTSGSFIETASREVVSLGNQLLTNLDELSALAGTNGTKVKNLIKKALAKAYAEASVINLIMAVAVVASLYILITWSFKANLAEKLSVMIGTTLGTLGKWLADKLGIDINAVADMMKMIVGYFTVSLPFIIAENKVKIMSAIDDVIRKPEPKPWYKKFFREDTQDSITPKQITESIASDMLTNKPNDITEALDVDFNNDFEMPINIIGFVKVAVLIILMSSIVVITSKYMNYQKLHDDYTASAIKLKNEATSSVTDKAVSSWGWLSTKYKTGMTMRVEPQYYGVFSRGVGLLTRKLIATTVTSKEAAQHGLVTKFGRKYIMNKDTYVDIVRKRQMRVIT